MQAIKQFILKKNLLIRIILSYLFVGLLIIGVLTIIITSKVSENLTQEITDSTDRAIEQSYNTANILLNSTYKNFASAYASADIQTGFYSEDFDSIEMGRIYNKLYELSNTNPLVHSVYLFNYQKKMIFSSLSTVRTFDEFYDSKMLQLLESTKPYQSGIFIPRYVEFEIDGKEFNNNLISIPYLSLREDKITNGAMVLNLDQQVLQNTVMNGTASKSFQSMIINRQGTVISHSDSSIISANLSDRSYVKEITAASSQKGALEINLEGKDSRVFYIKSDNLGWTFIGVINYESLLSKVNEIKRYIIWVTAVMLVVVIVSGGIFTRMIYGPIHRLINNVSKSPLGTKQRQAVSEFDLLSGTFTYLENKIHDLQTSVADYQSAKRHEVLRLLTRGGWTNEEEMARKLKNVGIEFNHPHFIVCHLRLDSYQELLDKYSPSDISLFKYAVSNIAVELGASSFQVVSLDDGEDVITLVVNVPLNMVNQEMELKSLLREIQSNVGKFLKLSVSVAIGTTVHDMAYINQSWNSAYNGSRYRIVFGAECLITSRIEETRELVQDSQSSVLEKQVMDSMKQGDLAKTKAAVEEYMDVLRNAPYDEMMLLLTQLLIATARTAKAMAAEDIEEFRMDIGYLGQQLYKWETLEQIKEWYMELCEKTVSLRDRQSSQKNRLIVDKIKQYIHEHYADPSLTVEILVEVGGLSTNYMRKVFKDISDQSINVYLTEYRFEKAKELLVETEYPANKIGEMVGFENTNYFYVSFKKHFGKTPDHFRKHNKYKGSDD